MINPTNYELMPAPEDTDCFPAISFPIEQIGADGKQKVRRGEDWLRSGHNALAVTSDSPIHYGIYHQIECCAAIMEEGLPTPATWGQDHEGAYRQLPARPRSHMWMLMITSEGPSLWQHLVVMFGAKAAVWAYNRFGDGLMHLGRILLGLMFTHYVDDYNASDPSPWAESGFTGFEDMCKCLRTTLKQSKRQPPAKIRDTLGVIIETRTDDIVVRPRPNRKARLAGFIQNALTENKLPKQQAESLAGKLNFYNSAVFARLGRALLRPIYRRAHFGGVELGVDLSASLEAALEMLLHAPPRVVPVRVSAYGRPSLYADAFYETKHGIRKAGDSQGETPELHQLTGIRNGWGIVLIRPGYTPEFMFGSIPEKLLTKFKSKKTFIFIIEVIAQCLGQWLFQKELGTHYWSFVDNVGARFSLTKGYTRDRDANAVVSLFWASVAARGTAPWFEHVPSKAQLADAVSRGDLDTARERAWKGWTIDTSAIWDLIGDLVTKGGIATFDTAAELDRICSNIRSNRTPMALGGSRRRLAT
jgi:hypothetical protein